MNGERCGVVNQVDLLCRRHAEDHRRETSHASIVIVRPLRAGPLHVSWSVVGHDGCRKVDTDKGSGAADIRVEATGLPEVVVKDFAAKEPKERIYSPVGDCVIEIYGGRYRIVDAASGALG